MSKLVHAERTYGPQRLARQFQNTSAKKVKRRFYRSISTGSSELGGSNRFADPQEHLLAALNACMTVGYAAQCAVREITLESLEIETEGEIDLWLPWNRFRRAAGL